MVGASLLEGRVAVITGGGGGIGSACARALAAAGARVAVLDRDADAARAVGEPLGGIWVGADVGDEASMTHAAVQITGDLGPVDILINGAAMFQAPAPVARLRMEKWDDVVRVTQRGTYLCCSLFGEAMAARGGGAIVNIASVGGIRSLPFHAYSQAKAAVIMMTATLACEWGARGVRVNALSPGFTRTPAVQAAIDQGHDTAPVRAGTPMGRLVEPDEVAQAALFLVSPAASAITGINLPVDCGWLAGNSWQAYGGVAAGTSA